MEEFEVLDQWVDTPIEKIPRLLNEPLIIRAIRDFREAFEDFRNFQFRVHKAFGYANPVPLQYSIGSSFQNPKSNRQIFLAPRGTSKSFEAAVFMAWCIARNPAMIILISGETAGSCEKFMITVKSIIHTLPEMWYLKQSTFEKYHNNKVNRGDRRALRNNSQYFDVGCIIPIATAGLNCIAIGGTLTSNRANLIFGDDVEGLKSSLSKAERNNTFHRTTELEALCQTGGRIYFLGTPHCDDDGLYPRLIDERGYTITAWTAVYETMETYEKLGIKEYLNPFMFQNPVIGDSTNPVLLPLEKILEARKLGNRFFNKQYMMVMRNLKGEGNPLTIKNLAVCSFSKLMRPLVHSNNPLHVIKERDLPNLALGKQDFFFAQEDLDIPRKEVSNILMVIDPSGKGQDETAYAIGCMSYGTVILMDFGGFLGGYTDETLEKLVMLAKKWGVQKIYTEANFGGGMFTQLLKPVIARHYPCPIEDFTSSKQKEIRIIDSIEPLLDTKRLAVDFGAIQKDFDSVSEYEIPNKLSYSLIYQLTRIVRTKDCLDHDDRLDAVAKLCSLFKDVVSVDKDTEIENDNYDWLRKMHDRAKEKNLYLAEDTGNKEIVS